MSWRLYVTDTGKKVVRAELDQFGVDARARMIDLMNRANRGKTLPRESEHIEGDIYCLRELIQSLTVRSELPPLTLGVMRSPLDREVRT